MSDGETATPRPKLVLRPRLVERLNEGWDRKLTLLSAPASFGKTTLLSDWVTSCGRPVAWLSLDEGDKDLMRFLFYLVSALQTVAPNIGAGVLSVLQSPQAPPTESVLTALLNDIASLPEDLVLVLDDYHAIDSKLVDQTLAIILEHQPPQMPLLAYLADYELLYGDLRGALQMYEHAVELAEKWGGRSSLALCFVQQGKAGLFYERNDLDGATRALQECIRIGELWKSPRLLVPAYGLSALVMQARGQADEARSMIHRAEQITRNAYSSPPDLGTLALYQIALWIAQDDFQAIIEWEHNHDSVGRSKIGRARDAFVIFLAHARITRYYRLHENSALSQARALIEPVLAQTQTSGLMYYVTRLLIIETLVLYAQGETSSAIEKLKHLLALAEPENYVRSFLDISKPMEEFLLWSLESGSLKEPHLRAYVSKLLSRFGVGLLIKPSPPTGDRLIEPLTEREMEVLKLIAQGLSNCEISERLFLALSTVKGHTRIIFDKLQVQRRTEAVAHTRELGIL